VIAQIILANTVLHHYTLTISPTMRLSWMWT